MNWLIAAPAWGERCVELFVNAALPAIKAAAERSSGTVRFMVHTDSPKRIKEAINPFGHRVVPIPKGGDTPHAKFGNCHREAIAYAEHGECIAFINADMVPSVEVFEAAEKRFAEGKRMIMMAATRTRDDVPRPPCGAKSSDLLRWTMDNRHSSITELFWGTGRSKVPWSVYFKNGDDIVVHGFHLHPFAAMKDRNFSFQRKTIDADLPDTFTREEIHIVTDANEMSFAEISPDWRVFKLWDHPITVQSVAEWGRGAATPVHQWFFGQRIAIQGNGQDIGDGAVCDQILRAI